LEAGRQLVDVFQRLSVLREIPSPPQPKNDSEFAEYERALSEFKKQYYNTLYNMEYYLLRCSKNAQDYYYLYNRVPIIELGKFILKYFLMD